MANDSTSKLTGITGVLSNATLQGDSAYTVAVQNGFEGTEAEWLASLKGDTGIGINSVSLNPNYTLTITMDDGTAYTTESIRGEQGIQGIQGKTGNGVRNISVDSGGYMDITLDDGTSYRFYVKGDKGNKGDKGDKGDTGNDGISTTVEVTSDSDSDYRLTFTDVNGSIETPNLIPEASRFAELTDIRIGADGTVHSSAGDAVRDQVSDLKQDFDAEIDVVTRKMALVKSPNLLDPNAVTENTLINGGNGDARSNNSYYSTDYIDVEGASVIYLYNATPSASQMRTGAFYNENKIFISGFTAGVTSASVPANAKYARVSVSNTDSPSTKMLVADRSTMRAFYAYYDPYFIASDDFIIDLDIDNTTFNDVYMDYNYVNRLNPEECQTGKFINGTTGAITDNATYFVTNYIPIRENETIYIYRGDTLVNKNLRTVAAYDRNKNLLSGYGTNTEASSYTQVGDVAFIRATIFYNASDSVNTPDHTMVVASNYPIYTSRYGNTPSIKSEYIRKRVQIFATDSESAVIDKMVNAYYQNNCDVYFECGVYNFGDVLANIKTTYNLLENEIPIGNGCRYFFNGATLNAVIDVSEDTDFYCNLFGTQRSPSDFELHDGILKATDTRYVVHDEASGRTRSYKHLYDNIEMEYTTVNRTEAIRKCIGGGTGKFGVVEIVGCKFITDGTDACVSFHGNSTDVAGAKFLLNVRGSWFHNNIRAGELSANQTAKLFYTGNSSASQYQSYARWDVTAFLNEIRS